MPSNATLESAGGAVNSAATDPAVAEYAPRQLERAKEALSEGDRAWAGHDLGATEHFAYLAQRSAQIAGQTAKLKFDEAEIAKADAGQNSRHELNPVSARSN